MNLKPKPRTRNAISAFVGFALLVASASPAAAQAQSKDQQKCLNAMGGYVSRIDTTQAREDQSCVKDYGKGKLTSMTVTECLLADRKGRMAKLEDKIQEKQTDPDRGKCLGDAEPDFGFLAPDAMVDGVAPEQAAFLSVILGNDPESVIVDATDRANRDQVNCQNTIIRTADKIVATEVKGFKSCMTKGLRSRTDPISSASELAECIDDEKLAEKTDKAEAKLVKMIGKKCTEKSVDWDSVVAGDCASEANPTDYASCVRTAADCTACLAIEGGYGIDIDCDAYAGATCEGGPSPRGAFVDGPILF